MLNEAPVNSTELNSVLSAGFNLLCRVLNNSATSSIVTPAIRNLLFKATGVPFTDTIDVEQYVNLAMLSLNQNKTSDSLVYYIISLTLEAASATGLPETKINTLRALLILAKNTTGTPDTVQLRLGFLFALAIKVLNDTASGPVDILFIRALGLDPLNNTASVGSYKLIHTVVLDILGVTTASSLDPAELLLVTWLVIDCLGSLTTGSVSIKLIRSIFGLIANSTLSTNASVGAIVRDLILGPNGNVYLTDLTPDFLNAIQVALKSLNTTETSAANLAPLIKLAFTTLNLTVSDDILFKIARGLTAHIQNKTESLDILAGFIRSILTDIRAASITSDDLVLLLVLIIVSSKLGYAKPEPASSFEKPVSLYNYTK